MVEAETRIRRVGAPPRSSLPWRWSAPSLSCRPYCRIGFGSVTKRLSVGIRVDLPFEQDINAFVTEAFEHRTFFTRLHQFVLASDAFLVAPGGIGTVLETMMI